MIWDMPTVDAVRHHYVEGTIDLSVALRAGSYDPLFDRLHRELNGTVTAHYGAVIDKEDCRAVKVAESQTLMTETYRMYWEPTDRPGEIMGGKHDGITTPPPDSIGTYMAPLQMPNDDPAIAAMYVSDPVTGEHPIITYTNRYTEYEVSGWSDMHRRWIYTPREKH